MANTKSVYNCTTHKHEFVEMTSEEISAHEAKIFQRAVILKKHQSAQLDAFNAQQTQLNILKGLGVDPVALGIPILSKPKS